MVYDMEDDINVWDDVPACTIPESNHHDDFRNHCDDDGAWNVSM